MCWSAAYGLTAGLLWYATTVALAPPYSTLVSKVVGAATFGALMGLCRLGVVRRRRRRAPRTVAATAAGRHWTTHSTFGPFHATAQSGTGER